jgi:hypothetical protein
VNLPLTINYRSTPTIVEFHNGLINVGKVNIHQKKMTSSKMRELEEVGCAPVELVECNVESDFLLAELKKLKNFHATKDKSVGILARTNREVKDIGDVFKKNGIPFAYGKEHTRQNVLDAETETDVMMTSICSILSFVTDADSSDDKFEQCCPGPTMIFVKKSLEGKKGDNGGSKSGGGGKSWGGGSKRKDSGGGVCGGGGGAVVEDRGRDEQGLLWKCLKSHASLKGENKKFREMIDKMFVEIAQFNGVYQVFNKLFHLKFVNISKELINKQKNVPFTCWRQ